MLHNNQIETLQLTKLIDSNVSSTLALLIKKSTVQDVEQIGTRISEAFKPTTKTGPCLAESQLNHMTPLHGLDDIVERDR